MRHVPRGSNEGGQGQEEHLGKANVRAEHETAALKRTVTYITEVRGGRARVAVARPSNDTGSKSPKEKKSLVKGEAQGRARSRLNTPEPCRRQGQQWRANAPAPRKEEEHETHTRRTHGEQPDTGTGRHAGGGGEGEGG